MVTMSRKSATVLSALVFARFCIPTSGASWGNTIPAAEHFVEAVRVNSLAYEIDSADSGALQLSKTPLDLRWYGESEDGVERSRSLWGAKPRPFTSRSAARMASWRTRSWTPSSGGFPSSCPAWKEKGMGTVHGGFQRALKGVLPALDAALVSAIEAKPGYQIRFVGHSLGGALAHLYGLYVAKTMLKNSNVRVMTVGQPRVGDSTLCKSVESTKNLAVFRLVFEDDVIGRIPLPIAWSGYSHAGHLLMIRRGGIFAYYLQDGGPPGSGYAGVPRHDWALSFLGRPDVPIEFLAEIVRAMLDHAPWNYNKAIDRAVRDGTFPAAFQTTALADESAAR